MWRTGRRLLEICGLYVNTKSSGSSLLIFFLFSMADDAIRMHIAEMMCPSRCCIIVVLACIAYLHDLLPLDSKLKGSNVVEACCRISDGSRS